MRSPGHSETSVLKKEKCNEANNTRRRLADDEPVWLLAVSNRLSEGVHDMGRIRRTVWRDSRCLDAATPSTHPSSPKEETL